MFRGFESVLDECLAAMQLGASVDQCLARYPKHANRLRPYLDLAEKVSSTPLPGPRPVAQATGWNTVRGRAAELRTGKRRLPAMPSIGLGPWVRPVAIVLAVFVTLAAISSGTALASQDAMPDSPLYRVKLASEDVHLWFVFDDQHEAEILLDQSNERTNEIRTMTRQGKDIPGIVLSSLDSRNQRAAAKITEIDSPELRDRLRNQALGQEYLLVAVQRDVKPSADTEYREAFASVHNSYFVGSGAFTSALLSEELADGVQTVSGVVERSEDGTWTVGGIEVAIDARTIGDKDLESGVAAELVLGISSNGRRQALSITKVSGEDTPSGAIVSGEIEEVGQGHIVIGGQTIPLSPDTFLKLQPKVGRHVNVRIDKTNTAQTVSEDPAVDAASSNFTYVGVMESDLSQALDEFTVAGVPFLITADTTYNFTAGDAVSGARVLVEGTTTEGGEIEAKSLVVLATDSSPVDSVYLVGTFQANRSGLWMVSGLEVGSPPGSNVDLAPGTLVAIDGRESDGAISARDLFVIQEPGDSLVRLEGVARTVDDTEWDFGFSKVSVDSTAEVAGKPLAGTRAIVWGSKDAQTGRFDAVYVRVLDQRPVIVIADEGDGGGGGG